jgi:hypothetical protein
MNTSNRFNMETIARQHQVEMEKRIRQNAQIRNASPIRGFTSSSPHWKFGVVSFGLLSLVALIILNYLF